MAVARRIIFGSYVIPTQSIETEETSIRHTEFQTSPNGTLGGKGIVTIAANQSATDGWTSFAHQNAYWEDMSDDWNAIGETWTGEWSIGTSAINQSLTDDASPLTFLYIKNTGDTNYCLVSLNGIAGNYYIEIPPKGSVHLRGDGTTLERDAVYVKSNTSTTTIEFIIAK